MKSNPIFVCGTGRSGTTITMRVLGNHPQIYAMRYEGRFVAEQGGLLDIEHQMNDNLKEFGELLLGDWYKKVYREGTDREYVGGMHTEIEGKVLRGLYRRYRDQISESFATATREFTESIYADCSAPEHTHWLEKTPSNLLHMPKLLATFPNAKFVHVIRDGRDVAQSIVDNGFWPIGDNWVIRESFRKKEKNIRNGARFWKRYLTRGLKIASRMPAGSYCELRLESLIGQPESELKRVCDFLGLDFSQKVLNIPLSSSSTGKWQRSYSKSDKADFKEEAGELLIKLGYAEDDNW